MTAIGTGIVRRARIISPDDMNFSPFGGTFIVTTTFDPAFLYFDATLSNGNLSVFNFDGASVTSTRSTKSESAGKFYCEFTQTSVTSVGTDQIGVGICNGSQTTAQSLFSTLNAISYFTDGGIYINAVSQQNIGTWGSINDIVGMAVDITNQLIWFQLNGGNWNNNVSANPATGIGGQSFSTLNAGPYFAAIECRKTAATVNFGASAYANVAPSGFGNWI